jgi:hypothetical protein
MVAAGSTVSCQVSSTTTFFSSPDDVMSAVSSVLAQSGYGVRNASTQTAGVLDQILGMGSNFPFQGSLDVQVPSAFADPSDVLSIVENAFYQTTGAYPSAAAVISVTGPNGGLQQVSSGLSSSGIGGSTSGVTSSLTSGATGLLSGLAGAGSNLLIGAVVLILAVLLIVGYAPNTGKVAGALS